MMVKFSLLFFFLVGQAQASYLDKHGNPVIDWLAENPYVLVNDVMKLNKKFTNKYFKNWFYTYMVKNKFNRNDLIDIDSNFDEFFQYGDQINEECRTKNLCTLFDEVGSSRAIKMIYIKETYNVNVTHHKTYLGELRDHNEAFEPFTELELLSIIMGLELFKDNLHFISDVDLKMTYANLDKGTTLANAVMFFYPTWRSSPFFDKVAVVLHELYHVLDGFEGRNSSSKLGINLSGDQEWIQFSQKIAKDLKTDGKNCYVSLYAQSKKNYEDSAESLVAYFRNRELLEEVCPQKVDIITRVLKEAKARQVSWKD